MNNRLIKTGAIGSIITAICCFTPALVWVLGLIGLTAVVAYLDYALFPLLALFIGLAVVGILRKEKNETNKT